jgi:hypothetical protein
MADETIGIISALNEAGLLGTAPTASGAAGVIGVLSEAGLLRTGVASGVAAGPPPPAPSPAHEVGDKVYAGNIRQIGKQFELEPNRKVALILWNSPEQGKWEYYRCEFPPSDDEYLLEFEKIIAAPKTPRTLRVRLEIETVGASSQSQNTYSARVIEVFVDWNNPEPSLGG